MIAVELPTTEWVELLDELLDEIEEYLDARADIRDGAFGQVIPNRAMTLLGRLRALREAREK